jgi:hypothetical protein
LTQFLNSGRRSPRDAETMPEKRKTARRGHARRKRGFIVSS